MLRRLILLVTVALAASSCTGSGNPQVAGELKPDNPSQEIPDLSPGDTLLVVGTSVMQQFGEALKEALEPSGVKVINEARPMTYGFGDETPIGSLKKDFEKHVKSAQPDLVLVQATFSVPVYNCSGSPEEIESCKKEGSIATASMLLPDMIDVLSATGARVVWVAFPATLYGLNIENKETSITTDAANAAASIRAQKNKDIIYSQAADHLGTDMENIRLFTKVDGGYRQLRGPDGIHACQYGTQLVVEDLADDIYPEWRTKAAQWPGGAWRQGESYTMERYPWEKIVCSDEVVPEPIVYKAP
jgi:hypothetical protein